jgi:hypothetical protein
MIRACDGAAKPAQGQVRRGNTKAQIQIGRLAVLFMARAAL